MIATLRERLSALRSDHLVAHLSQASAVSMAVRVAGLLLAFLAHLVLSRSLGANQYGQYAIALGWAMVLVVPARLGLDNSVLRFATVYREEGQAADFRGLVVFSLAIIAMLSAAISAAIVGAKLAGFVPLRAIDLVLILGIALIIPFLALIGWLSALIRTSNRIFASQFYDQALRPALLIGAIALVALGGYRLTASLAMILTAATLAIATIGLALHTRTAFAGLPVAPRSLAHRSDWLSVSWVLFLMAVVQEMLNQIDLILLGIVGNATQAAHFAAAWRLASLVPFGLAALSLVSGPLIASAYHRRDLAELARIARISARFAALFGLATGTVLAIFGAPLLGLFGPGFADAYQPLLILLAGALVNCFTGVVGYFLMLTGHQREALVCLAIALTVSVVANLLLIPPLGAAGAAIASALGLACWNLLMVLYVRRYLGIDATAIGAPTAGAKFE